MLPVGASMQDETKMLVKHPHFTPPGGVHLFLCGQPGGYMALRVNIGHRKGGSKHLFGGRPDGGRKMGLWEEWEE